MKYFLIKKNFQRIILIIIFSVITLQTQETNAQQVDYSGTSSANFLKIGVG